VPPLNWGQTLFFNWGQTPFFRIAKRWGLSPVLLCLALGAAHAQERTIELGGETIRYTLRADPTDGGALATARELARDLTAGDIEAAAKLSNAPQHRYEVLRDYRDWVGAEEFKRVYAQYFAPGSRAVAEISIGPNHLLVWKLDGTDRLAGQFYAEIGGRFLLDDVPSAERGRLRQLLDAYRAGLLAK
jgi:hypothetical protein